MALNPRPESRKASLQFMCLPVLSNSLTPVPSNTLERRDRVARSYLLSANSRSAMSEPSAKAKVTAEEKCCLQNSATAGFSFIDLSSPYFRKTARDGSKHMIGEVVSSSRSTIFSKPVLETGITPQTTARTPATALTKAPCTGVDSVMSLCNRSFASCGEGRFSLQCSPRADALLRLPSSQASNRPL